MFGLPNRWDPRWSLYTIEPSFFGPQAEILSDEKAVAVIRANGYYLYVYGFLFVGFGLFSILIELIANAPIPGGLPEGLPDTLIVLGVVVLSLTWVACRRKSRVAAVILLLLSSVHAVERIMTVGMPSLLLPLIMVAASYRLTKATRYLHQSRKAQQSVTLSIDEQPPPYREANHNIRHTGLLETEEVPMDSLTSLVTALAAGAAAALKPTAEQAVKDSYAVLKGLIQRKYTQVNVNLLEQDPTSENRRAVVKEDLAKTDAARNAELLHGAKALLDAVYHHAPDEAGAIGVDLRAIKAASLTINEIIATGIGVRIEGAEVSGDMTISKVQADGRGGLSPNS